MPGLHMPHVVVNTRPSTSAPFIIVDSSERTIRSSTLLSLASAIESMPVKTRIPKKYDNLVFPRVYMIVYRESVTGAVVQDIMGLRVSGSTTQPSPWCYTKGYWHPMINVILSHALRKAVELESVPPEIEIVKD